MNNSLKLTIKKGSQGMYYTIDGNEDIAFDCHFPMVWAIRDLCVQDFPNCTYPADFVKEKKVTGALNCNGCRLNGCFNGVIVSYCIDCVTDLRSIGEKCGCLCMYDICSLEEIKKYERPCDDEECCLKTYLNGIKSWEIGDKILFEKNGCNDKFIESEVDCIEMEEYNYLPECDEEKSILSESSDSEICSLNDILDNISCTDLELEEDSSSMPELVEVDSESDNESGFYRR